MSNFVLVDIRAESTVRYSKQVNMTREDYEKYLAICKEYPRDIDEQITEMVVNYGFFADADDIEDMDDPVEIEIVPVPDKQHPITSAK